jgi:uncharacterized protein YgbK (DUF1537 family)
LESSSPGAIYQRKEEAAKFAVIADDITGACDSGMQFQKEGFRTIVLITKKNIQQNLNESDVIVFDTDSRDDPPLRAYRKVRTIAKMLKTHEIEYFYKKVDSTLRGNIGRELDAVMDALGIRMAIVAPAFPAYGRTTVDGYQLVNGLPITEAEFANDLLNPVSESHIPTLLKNETKRKVGHIGLLEVAKGAESLKNEIEYQVKEGKEIVVIDATTQDHLSSIAKAAFWKAGLICGSAGLAEELAKRFSSTVCKPVMVISGSLSDITRTQILKAEHEPDVQVIYLDPQKILCDNKAKRKEIQKIFNEGVEALADGKNVLIAVLKPVESGTIEEAIENLSNKAVNWAPVITEALGDITERILNCRELSGLILTGGKTAISIFKNLGAQGLLIENEALPGIPSNRLIGGKRDGLRGITKAGGFGDENTIVKAIQYLKASQ